MPVWEAGKPHSKQPGAQQIGQTPMSPPLQPAYAQSYSGSAQPPRFARRLPQHLHAHHAISHHLHPSAFLEFATGRSRGYYAPPNAYYTYRQLSPYTHVASHHHYFYPQQQQRMWQPNTAMLQLASSYPVPLLGGAQVVNGGTYSAGAGADTNRYGAAAPRMVPLPSPTPLLGAPTHQGENK